MKPDLIEEFSEHQSILLIVSSENYNKTIIDILKRVKDKSVCYVTLNKTVDSLKEILTKNKVNYNKIAFIDAITKTIKKAPDQSDKCYFVSSPGALTELSIAINSFLKQNFDYIILDSLTNLIIYEKKAPVAKFISSLNSKIKETKTKAVFLALELKEENDLISETGMFVDKTIRLKQ